LASFLSSAVNDKFIIQEKDMLQIKGVGKTKLGEAFWAITF
jgi:hypothetical protein